MAKKDTIFRKNHTSTSLIIIIIMQQQDFSALRIILHTFLTSHENSTKKSLEKNSQ